MQKALTMTPKTLFSRARTEIFRLLFGITERKLHLREIERQANLNVATIRRELRALSKSDLVTSQRDGNRLYYCANYDHPLYPDIRNIVLKTSGLVDILKPALSAQDIQIAFVFGSLARHEALAQSDIDLMVIGTVSLRTLVDRLTGLSEQLGREVNPHVLSPQKLKEQIQNNHPLITRVMNSPKLFIKGEKDELAAMG